MAKLPQWLNITLLVVLSIIVLIFIVLASKKPNANFPLMTLGTLGFGVVAVSIPLLYSYGFILKDKDNTCDPTDEEREAAGGDGVLTFSTQTKTFCGAETCNTVAGYSLTDAGICAMSNN